MIWFGAGMFLIGISLLLGYILFGKEDNNNKTDYSALMKKYLHKGDTEEIEQIIDNIDSLTEDNRKEITVFINESGFSERLKGLLTDRDYRLRVQAVTRLGKIGGPGTADVIFEAMADKNEEVRMAAANAIRLLNDPSIIPQLIGALSQPNKWLPARIAETLLYFGNQAIPPMIEALEKEDSTVKAYLIEILGEIEDPGIVFALAGCLRDDNPQVRLQTVRALGKSREKGTEELLMGVSNDPDPRIQIQVLRSLVLKRGSAVIGILGEKLNSSEPRVRMAAFDLLRNMGPEGLEIIREAANRVDHPMAIQSLDYLKISKQGK